MYLPLGCKGEWLQGRQPSYVEGKSCGGLLLLVPQHINNFAGHFLCVQLYLVLECFGDGFSIIPGTLSSG